MMKICSAMLGTLLCALVGCSSDISPQVAKESIQGAFPNNGSGVLVGEVKRRNMATCLREVMETGGPPELVRRLQVTWKANGYYTVYLPVQAAFKGMEGLEMVSDFERRAKFTYELNPVSNKDIGPFNEEDLFLSRSKACMQDSPVLGLLIHSGGKRPLTIGAVASFKRFTDGWQLDNFSSEYSGPLETRPPLLLVPEDKLIVAQ